MDRSDIQRMDRLTEMTLPGFMEGMLGDLERQDIEWALTTIEGQVARLERITDLVRYQRHELFEAELISSEEYASLAQHPGAVDRLEGYDAALAKLKHNFQNAGRLVK